MSSSRAAKAAPAAVGGGTVVRARGPLCTGTLAALGRSGRARTRASASATTRSMSTPGSVRPRPGRPAPLPRLWRIGAAVASLVLTTPSVAPPTPRGPCRAPRVPRCSVNQRFLPARMRARSWASMAGSSASPLLPTARPAPPPRSAASASASMTVGGCRAPGGRRERPGPSVNDRRGALRAPLGTTRSSLVAPLAARDARVALLVGSAAAATAAADARVDGRAGASAATRRASTTDGPTSANVEGSISSSITSATPACPEWAISPATGRWEAAKDRVHGRRHTVG